MVSETHRRASSSNPTRLAVALLSLGWATGPAAAQGAGFVPFGQFVAGLSASTAPPSAPAARSSGRVATPAAFGAMRGHLLGLYGAMTVKHSYMLADHHYDCVPIMQQPSVRALGLTSLPTPAAMPSAEAPAVPEGEALPIGTARGPDPYGNATVCESGTIPMRRVTLDDMARFGSLAAFFHKSPTASQVPQRPNPVVPPAADDVHKYAYSYQYVTNVGGSTDINVWSPKVDTSQGQVFSLSQFWYVNTTSPIQTVEGGSQVYPDLYGTDKPSLFIYWTSDEYDQVGCYNLTCPGFVQTNGAYELGGPFPRTSTPAGEQVYARMSAVKRGGDWWIYLGGTDAAHAIGYYPAAVFHGRPITVSADLVEYGGETVGSTVWPQMGSGTFAQARVRRAAAQKLISYLTPGYASVQANLSAAQPSIGCYTNVTRNNSGIKNWNSFLFFGGPGGSGC